MRYERTIANGVETFMSPEDAFKVLSIKITDDKDFLRWAYRKSVLQFQEREGVAEEFVRLRAAYEVALQYIENVGNIKERIDFSYLLEALVKLSCLQEIRSRYEMGAFQENGFWKEAEELLKSLESMNFKNKESCPDSLLAEAYYQMIFVCEMAPVKKGDLAPYLKQFGYARKALDKEKDAEYLYWCGCLLSQSWNKDSNEQAIEYLLEAEQGMLGRKRTGDLYWNLSCCYYYKEDYKSAFMYAKKRTEIYPDYVESYRVLGSTAYDLLVTSSNRMYMDAAVKAFSLALSGDADFWQDTWVCESLCKIYTRSGNWGMLEKMCGEPKDTLLSKFAYNYYKAVALLNRGNAKSALHFFKDAYALKAGGHNSDDYSLYANISRCYEEVGIYEKALEWMKEFQQFQFHDINYPKKCMMHFFLRNKRYEEARRTVEQFATLEDDKALIKFQIDFCQAVTDEQRQCVIEKVQKYMPYIQETERRFEKNGYHVKRGSVWDVKISCRIGDTYWYILKDDQMAIRYYELAIHLVDYRLSISGSYPDPKREASYSHYMLMRVYGELCNKKKMQEHADFFMDYIKEYYSDDDSKSIEEQYISALNDLAPAASGSDSKYMYMKPDGEMGTEYGRDYNACKLAYYYLTMGNVSKAQEIAVYLAKKYRKDIPAEIYVLMGDLARIAGNKNRANDMYRFALDKNPWVAYKAVRYLLPRQL